MNLQHIDFFYWNKASKKLLHTNSLLSVFQARRIMEVIKDETILWNNKPIKEKSVLLWDLENIPFKRLQEIKRLAKYTPDELYVITKQRIGEKLKNQITKEHFKILDAHKSISDDKIISIMKLYKDRPNMMLISSDSDFTKEANKYLKNGKLHWIVTDVNKKAIVMRVNLASINLTISSIVRESTKKQTITKKAIHRAKYAKKLNTNKKQNKLDIYIDYFSGKIARFTKKVFKTYRRIKYFISSSNENSKMKNITQIHINNPLQGKREVFRHNYKGRRVRAGSIQFNSNGEKILTLYKKLSVTYIIPSFPKIIRFNDFQEVDRFIHFNYDESEYYLNNFERKEDENIYH